MKLNDIISHTGMAQMISPVDYHAKSSVWAQDKWKGQFKVKWVYVKDVPNAALRHIRLENNENKPVTNSRDTQVRRNTESGSTWAVWMRFTVHHVLQIWVCNLGSPI